MSGASGHASGHASGDATGDAAPVGGAVEADVERHYGRGGLLDALLSALASAGKDVERLTPDDLAPVDAFHARGRKASVELADAAGLIPGERVLDVGCGLGGALRFLAAERGCRVTGVDLTQEYVDAAAELAARTGLGHVVRVQRASALALPFADGSFDVAWTEHAQMNVADKRRFYAEIARVLRPGGRFAFHDIFEAGDGAPHYPVPWAERAAQSHLARADAVRALLEALGLRVTVWADRTEAARAFFASACARLARPEPPPVGTHLLMGPLAAVKLGHCLRNLEEGRLQVLVGVAVRP